MTADDSESVYNIVNCQRFGIWRLSMSGLSDRQLCGDEFGFMSVADGSTGADRAFGVLRPATDARCPQPFVTSIGVQQGAGRDLACLLIDTRRSIK